MKRKTIIIVLFLLFMINISALTTFSVNRWLKPQISSPGEDILSSEKSPPDQMALSQMQLDKMNATRTSLEKDVNSIRGRMTEMRIQLLDDLQNQEPDLSLIDRKIDELSRLQAEIQKLTVRNLLRDKELFTPGQRNIYFSLFEDHVRGRGLGRRGMGRGRGRQRWEKENSKNRFQ